MSETTMERLVIAAPENVAVRLTGILRTAGIAPASVCHAGAQALEAAGQSGALLLTTYRLPDMAGEELARRLGEAGEVLMIVPQDYAESEETDNVLTLRNPISQDALIQAVRTMCYCAGRMQELKQKAQKLERQLAERKVIERAKGRLMDALHLSESEAHYRMQKQSMDTGRRIVDVAQEILDSVEIAS